MRCVPRRLFVALMASLDSAQQILPIWMKGTSVSFFRLPVPELIELCLGGIGDIKNSLQCSPLLRTFS